MLTIQQPFVSQVLAIGGEQIEGDETRLTSTRHQLIELRLILIEAGDLTIYDGTPRNQSIADLDS